MALPLRPQSTLRTLFWGDRNLLFHRYELCPPSRSLETLLAELDRDPTGIFWGSPGALLGPLDGERDRVRVLEAMGGPEGCVYLDSRRCAVMRRKGLLSDFVEFVCPSRPSRALVDYCA